MDSYDSSSVRRRSILVLLLAMMFAAGCDRDADGGEATGFGPLAVFAGHSGDLARTEGTLRVTEDCVFLNMQGEDVLLVWPSDRTSWDPASEAISFDRSSGGKVTLRNGDVVTLGGGGSSLEEDGLEAEDWVAGIDWTAEPNPSCVTDVRWFVGDVVP